MHERSVVKVILTVSGDRQISWCKGERQRGVGATQVKTKVKLDH